MRRVAGVVLTVLLVVGVLAAVAVGTDGFGLIGRTTPVIGVIGSEKRPFFEDERVQKIFRDNGFDVTIDTAGSRQIATEALGRKAYDFAFPSSAPAGRKIQDEQKVLAGYDPFYSPMIVATFRPIADLLVQNEIVTEDNGVYTLDMTKYLSLVNEGTRWKDLDGNAGGEVYPADREILITSTDIRSSNSAAMYLSIASYIANSGQVVSTPEQADAVYPVARRIFLDQGFSQASSEGPFRDYLTLGLGRAPLVLAYESQFLGQQVQDAENGTKAITDDMVVLYPSPDVLSQHTYLSLTESGDGVGQLLTTDPQLQRLLAEYGFRVPDRSVFAAALSDKGVPVPPDIVDTADTPSFEVLERLITRLEGEYEAAGAPPATTAGDADGLS